MSSKSKSTSYAATGAIDVDGSGELDRTASLSKVEKRHNGSNQLILTRMPRLVSRSRLTAEVEKCQVHFNNHSAPNETGRFGGNTAAQTVLQQILVKKCS